MGLFWKRTAGVAPKAPAADRAGAPDEVDKALDALAYLLRVYGKEAFDTATSPAHATRGECDAWARRITVGEGRGGGGPASFRRDWAGLQRYFATQRRGEREHVVRSAAALRDALAAFARCLASAVGEERSADEHLGARLDRLVDAFGQNDPAAIRREAESVASAAREAMAQRRERQDEQVRLLRAKVHELRDELQQAREVALTDPLTRLYNRSALDAHLERIASLSFLLNSNPCLVVVDVDHFKSINDRHGHAVGDVVLRRVADELVRHFSHREDFVARYGGEEFVIVVAESTVDDARRRAEGAREAVRGLQTELGGAAVRATVSAGVAGLAPGDDARSWFARADAALYEAKGGGRDRVCVAGAPPAATASPPA